MNIVPKQGFHMTNVALLDYNIEILRYDKVSNVSFYKEYQQLVTILLKCYLYEASNSNFCPRLLPKNYIVQPFQFSIPAGLV